DEAGLEAHHRTRSELDLLQRSLTKPERIAEVAGRRVVEHRRLVGETPAYPNGAEPEVFEAAAEAERQLGFRRYVVRTEERRAETGKYKRLQPCVRAAESIDDVGVQLSAGHREQIGRSRCRADPQCRGLMRQH